ncbi:MAG TPA: flippase [Solirubrobacterales bacterium]|nr:flippase [Solirubrobacterales bacterium]
MSSEHELGGAVRARLASGFLLIRNALIFIGAQGAIAVMGLLAVPILVDRLGTARFGVLALAWAVIGYASLLDLGLGRALTKVTADRLGAGRPQEIPKLFWTAVAMLATIGVLVGGIVVALSGTLTNNVLGIPDGLVEEAQMTFVLLGCTVPFVLLSTALSGNLEAHQRFDLTNGVAVPLSFLSYFGPVAIALFTTNLALVVSAVCLSRVSATAIYLYLCTRVDPLLVEERRADRAVVGSLLGYGGWVALSSVVIGAMLTIDRFLIGTVLTATAVAFYATPYEASKQMLVIATAFANVLFPGFAANVKRDRIRTEALCSRGARATFVGLFPLALFTSVLSYEILDVWISESFAEQGGPVLQILAAGALINGLGFIAFALIQSVRPDIITKIAAVELVSYLGALWLLLQADGIEGAALAFSIRALADTAVLYGFARRMDLVGTPLLFEVARLAAAGVLLLALGALIPETPLRIAYVVVVVAAFLPIAWRYILSNQERGRVQERLGQMRKTSRPRSKRSAPDAV